MDGPVELELCDRFLNHPVHEFCDGVPAHLVRPLVVRRNDPDPRQRSHRERHHRLLHVEPILGLVEHAA